MITIDDKTDELTESEKRAIIEKLREIERRELAKQGIRMKFITGETEEEIEMEYLQMYLEDGLPLEKAQELAKQKAKEVVEQEKLIIKELTLEGYRPLKIEKKEKGEA